MFLAVWTLAPPFLVGSMIDKRAVKSEHIVRSLSTIEVWALRLCLCASVYIEEFSRIIFDSTQRKRYTS